LPKLARLENVFFRFTMVAFQHLNSITVGNAMSRPK